MTDTLSTEVKESLNKLDACIHCGMCLPACPTYRVTGSEAESPRGRLYLMKAFFEGKLDSPQQLADHIDPCLGCLSCMTACPSGVRYDALLETSREILVDHQPKLRRKIRRFFLQKVLPYPDRLEWLAKALSLYQKSGLQRVLRQSGFFNALGIAGKTEQFMPQIQDAKPIVYGETFGTNQKGRVALFTGCIMNAAYRQIHWDTIEVLTKNGYQVTIPPQTCCGALANHSGEEDIARTLADENVFRFLRTDDIDWIVVNAAGCGSTLKQYDHILSDHPDSAKFQQKVVDIVELLARSPLEGPLKPVPMKVAYHAACHLHHAQKIYQEPYAVLKQIPELELVPLTEADMCCGSAGVYNIAHPELSLAILEEKTYHVARTKADAVLAANPGCMLQLEAGINKAQLPMQVLHPIQVLAKAYL